MAREQDMKQTRKKHGAAFKVKVALAAIKADRTGCIITARHLLRDSPRVLVMKPKINRIGAEEQIAERPAQQVGDAALRQMMWAVVDHVTALA
jgi:hypothetical protein